MPLRSWLLGLFDSQPRTETGDAAVRQRGPATHVIILDGTMSTLAEGLETNAGLTYKLLREAGRRANLSVYYEAGIQWRDWSETFGMIAGRGINRQIERAYGVIASKYHPGDRIIFVGYSRGAFAVRSLAGAIDRVGLVRSEHATERNIRLAYRYYRNGGGSPFAQRFREKYCHPKVDIEAICVWDTVKSLGLRLPLLWKLEAPRHEFHSDGLVPCVKAAYHALALDETRDVFAPEVWRSRPEFKGHLEQVWFRGSHGCVGGHVGIRKDVRPLANISLVWMLEKLERAGAPLPIGWRERFPTDADGPAISTWYGLGKLFLARHRRVVGRDTTETIHPSAAAHPVNRRMAQKHRMPVGDRHPA